VNYRGNIPLTRRKQFPKYQTLLSDRPKNFNGLRSDTSYNSSKNMFTQQLEKTQSYSNIGYKNNENLDILSEKKGDGNKIYYFKVMKAVSNNYLEKIKSSFQNFVKGSKMTDTKRESCEIMNNNYCNYMAYMEKNETEP